MIIFPLSSNQQEKYEYFTCWHFIAISSWVFKEDNTSWKGTVRWRRKSGQNQLIELVSDQM